MDSNAFHHPIPVIPNSYTAVHPSIYKDRLAHLKDTKCVSKNHFYKQTPSDNILYYTKQKVFLPDEINARR